MSPKFRALNFVGLALLLIGMWIVQRPWDTVAFPLRLVGIMASIVGLLIFNLFIYRMLRGRPVAPFIGVPLALYTIFLP